jgi:hypothetical protein
MDENIAVPKGFAARMQESMDAHRVMNDLKSDAPNRNVRFIATAASVAILAVAGYAFADHMNQPKDTFDDPYLAYAQIEKAFAKISDSIGTGLAMVEESGNIIDKATTIFE